MEPQNPIKNNTSSQKPKKKYKIQYLINWYFGNYCAKCGRIDLESEDHGQKCMKKIEQIRDNLNTEEMTHKEFINIMRHTNFCHPFTRKFHECEICKRFGGLSDKYWIKNWKGWNLSEK